MDDKQKAAPFKRFAWSCTCDDCAARREPAPLSAEDLAKYADLIAAKNRDGFRPEKPTRRPRTMPGGEDFF